MSYIGIISIIVSFVIVINRIRKQDRYIQQKLDVVNADIKALKAQTGLSVNSVDYLRTDNTFRLFNICSQAKADTRRQRHGKRVQVQRNVFLCSHARVKIRF